MDNNSKPNSNAVFYLISDKFAFNVEHSCTLGRTRADIIIKDEKLSGVHCEFILKNAGCYVVDCDSRNGTFLNNEQLEPGKVIKLKVGDKLKLGTLTYVVKYGVSTLPTNMSRETDASTVDGVVDSLAEVDEVDSEDEESVDALYEEVYGSEVKKDKKASPVKKENKDKIVQKKIKEIYQFIVSKNKNNPK
jgi:pSer/pThr/pTyr-binding forkhead associated (FHA) protein